MTVMCALAKMYTGSKNARFDPEIFERQGAQFDCVKREVGTRPNALSLSLSDVISTDSIAFHCM